MSRILYLQSSLCGETGQSSTLARRLIAGIQAAGAGTEVVVRDLINDGVPGHDLGAHR